MFLTTGFGKSICYEVLPFVFDHKLVSCWSKEKLFYCGVSTHCSHGGPGQESVAE